MVSNLKDQNAEGIDEVQMILGGCQALVEMEEKL